jgi:transposase InsO family protein
VTYNFIAERCADLPVEHWCRVMKWSRSAFFSWRQRQASPTIKMADDAELGELIAKIHDQSFGTYGRSRITAELRLGLGRRVNHKRVARLMGEQGLQGVTRRRLRGCTRRRFTNPAATIWRTASSVPTVSTGCGYKTSPNTALAKAGSIWRW